MLDAKAELPAGQSGVLAISGPTVFPRLRGRPQ
jgi:hypothetical protein